MNRFMLGFLISSGKNHNCIKINCIILNGGFHQVRNRNSYICICRSCSEGCHYYRNMRINKEIFCALVQFRAKNITNDYQDLARELKEELILLGRKPSPQNLQNVIGNQNFQILCKNISEEQSGTESKMTIRYLKDVSSLLPLVNSHALREKKPKATSSRRKGNA